MIGLHSAQVIVLWKSVIFNELHIEPITQGFSIAI